MLFIFNKAAAAVQSSDKGIEWHKDKRKPFIDNFGTYTFQADGEELELLKNTILKASKIELIDFAWDWRDNLIAVIKEVRSQYQGMELLEAKLLAKALIAQAEMNHNLPPVRY